MKFGIGEASLNPRAIRNSDEDECIILRCAWRVLVKYAHLFDY